MRPPRDTDSNDHMDSRAVSNVVSAVLVTGIVLIGVSAVAIAGYQTISATEDKTDVETARIQLEKLDGEITSVAIGSRHNEIVPIGLQHGDAIIVSEELTGVRVQIGTVQSSQTHTRCKQVGEDRPGCAEITYKTYTLPSDPDVEFSEFTGGLEYRAPGGNERISWQLGGIVTSKPGTGDDMLVPPGLERRIDPSGDRPQTVVLNAAKVTTTDFRTIVDRAKLSDGSDRPTIIDAGSSNPGYIQPDQVLRIEIVTDYPEAWARYIQLRFPESATDDTTTNVHIDRSRSRPVVVLTVEPGSDGMYFLGRLHPVRIEG